MSLKSRNWFFGKCLTEERKRTKFTYLSAKALDLGFGREHTQGHILQACGATQMFLNEFPRYKRIIHNRGSPIEPYRIRGSVLRDWRAFLSHKHGSYGRIAFGYNWDNLKSYLTNRYGGNCSGGGGGDNELEIVLRLMVEFT